MTAFHFCHWDSKFVSINCAVSGEYRKTIELSSVSPGCVSLLSFCCHLSCVHQIYTLQVSWQPNSLYSAAPIKWPKGRFRRHGQSVPKATTPGKHQWPHDFTGDITDSPHGARASAALWPLDRSHRGNIPLEVKAQICLGCAPPNCKKR